MELDLDAALTRVAQGGLVAYPTETVWGLGADAASEAALEALRDFKGRGEDAPLSILVTGADALAPLGLRLEGAAERAARAFWPGPLTLVLPCLVPPGRGRFARGVARGDGAVGVRCSPHAGAAALAAGCARAGTGPVTATSCNRSGEPAARSRAEARAVCAAGPVALLAAGGEAGGGAPSTVVDFSGARPVVLRWGAVCEAALAPVVGAWEAA